MEQTVNAPADISADYSFIMDDDSMSGDGIRAGDIVYFTACDHVDNGQIAAVQTPDSVEILPRLAASPVHCPCDLRPEAQKSYYSSSRPGQREDHRAGRCRAAHAEHQDRERTRP